MTNVVVTGSSGFIGSRLLSKLRASDIDVTELDIATNYDITDWSQVENLTKFDLMFHLAAKSFVPDSYEKPKDFYHTNLIGTLNALELCRINKAKLIFISSYVYGVPQYLPIDEKHPLIAFNPYAQTKLLGEQLCQAYNRDFGLKVVIIRPFNIYGNGQASHFLIPTIISQAKKGIISLNDLKPKRDYVYIDDVIDLLIRVIYYNETDFEIFNAGSGKSYSVEKTALLIADLFDKDIRIESKNCERKTEIHETVADISKAKKLLEWTPKITFQSGLKKLLSIQ